MSFKLTPEEFIIFMANKKAPEARKTFLEIYTKSGLSAYDFCYIFPNNMLKRYGVPMRRGGRKMRERMKGRFMTYTFDPIHKVVSRNVTEAFLNGEAFEDYSYIKTGEENYDKN